MGGILSLLQQRLLYGLAVLLLLGAQPLRAAEFAWDALALPTTSLGQHVQVLREYGARWTVEEALQRFALTNPAPPRAEVLSFGIGAVPVWLRLPLHNPEQEALRLHLLLGTTWLDSADLYLLGPKGVYQQIHLGDEAPYAYGVLPGMGFGLALDLPPQATTLLVRAESVDPLILPLQLLNAQALASQREAVQYSYELIFGALFALILYNLTLFAVSRNPLHGRYALYVGSMLALALAYTGKGLSLWWADSPAFQRYIILCCMVIFNVLGLNFAMHFLRLRQLHPVWSRCLQGAQWATLGVMAALVGTDQHLWAVWWAFGAFLAFMGLSIGLAAWAVLTRQPFGGWFFAAVFISTVGAASAWLVVVGAVGYDTLRFRIMEAGFLVDAVLLAIALGRQTAAAAESDDGLPPG